MPNFTDLTGLASVATVIAASLLLLPGVKLFSSRQRAWATAAIFVVVLIPLGNMPLAAYVRGATGDLSITTLALLSCALLKPWTDCTATCSRQRLVLLALVSLTAVFFYPMALGFDAFDPYRLGYGNGWFVCGLLAATLAAWFWRYYQLVLCIALATLAWATGWYESGNLWDYLLDPFVSIYALAALMIRAAKSRRLPELQLRPNNPAGS